MSKFKVGDKVRVKSLKRFKTELLNKYNYFLTLNIFSFCGKVVTIRTSND